MEKNQVTVSELIKQLQVLESLGLGDAKVWYRDEMDFDYRIEQGIWDTNENHVVLGDKTP